MGESELGVGSRVVHKIFCPGIIEEMHASDVEILIMQIRFDRGDTKRIHGPGAFICKALEHSLMTVRCWQHEKLMPVLELTCCDLRHRIHIVGPVSLGKNFEFYM